MVKLTMIKTITIISLILAPFFAKAQSSFPQGKYVSNLGEIIIRNDSVISKDISYYVYYFSSQEENDLTIVSYESEKRREKLTVVYKNNLPRHLMLNYKNYSEETFNIAFLK